MHFAAWVVELCDLYVDLMIYFLINQLVHHLSTDYTYHQWNIFLLLILLCESLNLLDHHFWMYIFIDLDEHSHLFLLYVLKHFFDSNFVYHYFKTDLMQTCIQRYLFDSKIIFLQCSFIVFFLIWNISSFNYLFIVSMFLCVNSILLTSIFLAHLTMFFVVVIMILFISSFSLMKIFTSNFLQWFCINNDMLTLNIKWLSNDVVDFTLTFFTQLSTCFFFFMNFFSSLLIIFFSLFSWFFMHWLTVNAVTR